MHRNVEEPFAKSGSLVVVREPSEEEKAAAKKALAPIILDEHRGVLRRRPSLREVAAPGGESTSFLRYNHPRLKPYPPRGHFMLQIEEQKLPPVKGR